MLRRLAILPGLAILALTLLLGCQIFVVRDPAPARFRTPVCQAYEGLVMADQALRKRQLEIAASFIEEARQGLAGIPVWLPGAPLVVELRSLALVQGGGTAARSVALARVDREYKALADTHGFTCEWRYADYQWPSPTPR